MRRLIIFICPILFVGCIRDARDPFALAPSTPYATWTPMKGNNLVSSKYCRTMLPESFSSSELSLAELLDIALLNNPTTKQTWAMARASAAKYGESLSSFYPNVQFSSFYFRQLAGFPGTGIPNGTPGNPQTQTPISTTVGIIESYFTEAGPDVLLNYTLFDFGQRTAASVAAREALYYADLNHNQQIQSVLQTVMSDYYSYLYQMAVQKADEANLVNAQMALDAANEKFALGVVALGDVAQARTQFLQNRMNLTTQNQEVENAFALLAVDLGLPANLPFRVQPLPDQVVTDPLLEGIDDLVAVAQKQRQDFLAAQANLRAKEAALLQVKRSGYPTINSQLGTGRYWFNGGLTETKNHWTAYVTLTFPIFTGFQIQNQIKNAEAEVELSKADLMKSELAVIQGVTTAHKGVKTAATNLSDSEEYLKAAELQFNIALSSYKAGTATILDVVQAQSSLADARSRKANAQKEWFLSLANIAYATGSLCATPNEEVE